MGFLNFHTEVKRREDVWYPGVDILEVDLEVLIKGT